MTAAYPRIAFIVTRCLDEQNGRTNTMRAILEALSSVGVVTMMRHQHLLEKPSPRALAGAFLRAALATIKGRPPALQCVLYDSRASREAILKTLGETAYDVVYLDMVRCLPLARAIRRRYPRLRLVTDLDDLISHRMTRAVANHFPLSLGFTSRHTPGWLRRLIEGPLSRLIARYEEATLHRAELELVALTDAAALVSAAEAAFIREDLAPSDAAKVRTLVPPVVVHQAPSTDPPHRFVFVGSDRQIQNRLSIDWLVDFWLQTKPGLDLHIFGAQMRPAEETPGVHWRGFVEQAWEIYHPGSIALAPTLVGGGIKTKVLEAWGYGCPVLATPMALEDVPIEGYPLARPLDEWARLVRTPGDHLKLWREAAHIGHAFVAEVLTPAGYAISWRGLIAPP